MQARGDFLKYYGLKHKEKLESIMYRYAQKREKFLSLLPGKRQKYRKEYYDSIFNYKYVDENCDNSLPKGKVFDLDYIVIADLIRREDIKKLQNGIKYLLQKRKSNRFNLTPNNGLNELLNKINQMDSTLLCWYNSVDCGNFELKNHFLEESIDYFTLKICNINSGFLSVQFIVHLSEKKKNEINSIIACNYMDKRGFAFQTLTGKKNRLGSYKSYALMYYNNDFLKADKIYEFISEIEWEFLEELRHYFPLVLHCKEIVPPRIEIYRTNIDYQEEKLSFWDSVGINKYHGQFIDERHKMFFYNQLSGRYGDISINNRIIYVYKDDNIEVGKLRSIKDQVNYHIREYANDYFKFEFLDILSREAGKTVIKYKHKLDKIKLKRNHLNDLLKLKYNFLTKIDDYNRYTRDDIWNRSKKRLSAVYTYSDKIANKSKLSYFQLYSSFCDGIVLDSQKINDDIKVIMQEFDDKKEILQNLYDYKSSSHSIQINIIMLVLAAITLFFVIFPEKAIDVSKLIIEIWHIVKNYF